MTAKEKIIIDASDLILGRMSSFIAQRILRGQEIIVLNAERAVISGNRTSIVLRYKKRNRVRTATNPKRGPFLQKRPDYLVFRTVRGMVPWKIPSGRNAMKRLSVYIGTPDEYQASDAKTLHDITSEKLPLEAKGISVGELSIELGWNGRKYMDSLN